MEIYIYICCKPRDTLLIKWKNQQRNIRTVKLNWPECELLMKVHRMSTEHRATRQSRLFRIFLTHFLEFAQCDRVRLCVCVCVWQSSIVVLRLSRACLRFSPALRNVRKWLFNQWHHSKVNDYTSLLDQTCWWFPRNIKYTGNHCHYFHFLKFSHSLISEKKVMSWLTKSDDAAHLPKFIGYR